MKRTKKSQKKTKFLLLLIVLTAILSITATYAWFSTQKEVEISTLRLNIEVAESLEISLNGKEWANTITISDMRQFYGYAASGHQAAKNDNTNYVPTQLLPVSTTGSVADGKIQFMTTNNFSNGKLSATACTEDITASSDVETREGGNASHPYLVFDMYLKNLSASATGDPLRLNQGSKVWTDTTEYNGAEGNSTAGTGAENAMRVGFVQYAKTVPATTVTTDGSDIRELTHNYTPEGGGTEIAPEKAAIWEPNNLDHIQEVVNNDSRVTSTTAHVATYGLVYSASGAEITDIKATTGTTAEQKTIKPKYTVADGTTAKIELDTDGTASACEDNQGQGDIILPANAISKFRVYVWMEGQDVDCINTASTAGKLDIILKLDKKGSGSATSNTYKNDASTATPTPTPEVTP